MRRWGEGKNEKVGRRNKREGLEKDKMKWLRVINKISNAFSRHTAEREVEVLWF